MQIAQRETPEQLLDRVLDLNEPLVETVTRREAAKLLGTSLQRIVDIIAHRPDLAFPEPLGRQKNALRYSKPAIVAWGQKNPLKQIKWRQSERVEKPASGLDAALVSAFVAGRYDPEERQLENLKLRIAARSSVRRRQVVRVGTDDFSSHERAARKGRR